MAAVIPQRCSYIAGEWAGGDEAFAVQNPADETNVADVAAAQPVQTERAIVAARRSFDAGVWVDLPARDRTTVLHAFLDYIEAARDELVATIVAEAGQPVFFAEGAQLGSGLALGRDAIDLYLSMRHEEANPVPVDELVRDGVTLSIRRHEPVGVVAAITPYNAAFMMAVQKIIPALMVGCSVIRRPSPLTPLSSSLIFGAAADAAGLPPGVLSVVIEPSPDGAELLTSHPAVDMVSFTGSTVVGRLILAQAAPTVKRVAWNSAASQRRSTCPTPSTARVAAPSPSWPRRQARPASPRPACSFPAIARTRWSRRCPVPTPGITVGSLPTRSRSWAR